MSGANVDDVFDRVETKVKGLLDENAQLREQNRVLREALLKVRPDLYCMDKQLIASGYKRWVSVADVMKALEAALTATSQPAQEQCSYCKRPLTDNHSFSYGVPGVPRVYKCDRADCTKPATSQEGQRWTREKPSREGVYWFRWSGNSSPIIVSVAKDDCDWRILEMGNEYDGALGGYSNGEWQGPLTPNEATE